MDELRFFFVLQAYVQSAAIALVVGWTHLRIGFLLKLGVMILSIISILVALSQAPAVAIYYAQYTTHE